MPKFDVCGSSTVKYVIHSILFIVFFFLITLSFVVLAHFRFQELVKENGDESHVKYVINITVVPIPIGAEYFSIIEQAEGVYSAQHVR